eukprot:6193158-Pleurochrysis_carterae.AAC.2
MKARVHLVFCAQPRRPRSSRRVVCALRASGGAAAAREAGGALAALRAAHGAGRRPRHGPRTRHRAAAGDD